MNQENQDILEGLFLKLPTLSTKEVKKIMIDLNVKSVTQLMYLAEKAEK